jgi:CMP-N,N'-diacetyllegionaminic acid synthase
MRILALIAARGGSKRLPKKNTRLLGDKPLIVWSIDVVKGMPNICDILVSTDDAEISDICIKEGVSVPWVRPQALATDEATSADVAIHALDWYEANKGEVDGLLFLQPTSPFRSRHTILRAIELFESNKLIPIVAIFPTPAHPLWSLKIEGDYAVPFFSDNGLNMRSQELRPVYVVTGSVYLISPQQLRKNNSFAATKMQPLLIDSPKEAIDIDTEWDFRMAEQCLNDWAN